MEEDRAILTVVSFNMLAQHYLERNPPVHLKQSLYKREKRRAMMRQILDKHEFDVVCLQECAEYDSYYSNAFGQMGYRSRWECRKRKREGLCLLYKEERVELLSYLRVELDEVVNFAKCEQVSKSKFARSSIAQIARFKMLADGSEFLCVNVHLFWNPAVTDVKIFQAFYLVHQIQNQLTQIGNEDLPVVFCGDFNSMPKSLVMHLITKGGISKTHEEFAAFLSPYKDFDFSTPISFEVAPNLDHFTTYVDNFRGIIDYIVWRGNISLVQYHVLGTEHGLYKLVSDEDFEVLKGEKAANTLFALLPSCDWPSDHLAVVSTFRLCK